MDVVLVDGLDNIVQAVNMRLNTVVGSMLKQTAFGLVSGIGMAGTGSAISYVKMNIYNTLMQDPRIESVTDVKVGLDVDSLQISMNIHPVGSNTTIPVSVVL
jgi:hypothetical protein